MLQHEIFIFIHLLTQDSGLHGCWQKVIPGLVVRRGLKNEGCSQQYKGNMEVNVHFYNFQIP